MGALQRNSALKNGDPQSSTVPLLSYVDREQFQEAEQPAARATSKMAFVSPFPLLSGPGMKQQGR